MLRHSLIAALVVVALAGTVKAGHPPRHCCRDKVVNYLFRGYGPGPFGHGDFWYAGWYPYDNRTCCGCKVR